MMKKQSHKKHQLAQKVLYSLFAFGMLGLWVNFNMAQAQEQTEETSTALAGTKRGNGAEDVITFINSENTKITAVLEANKDNDLDISNYAILNVKATEEGFDGIHSNGANIAISDVGAVNIGTQDEKFPYGGQAIHAQNHSITLDVEELNIYTNGSGIMAQHTGNSEEPTKPSVTITTTGDVNINADKSGVMAASMNKNAGVAGVSINAGGKVSIVANERTGVQSFDADQSASQTGWQGDGRTSIEISGSEGVEIISKNSAAVYLTRSYALNDSEFVIKSENGDVNLTGKYVAVDIRNYANTKIGETEGITAVIEGNNVNLTGSELHAVYMNQGKLQVAGNLDNSSITLAGKTEAVKLSGSDTELTLGSDYFNNDIYIEGTISLADTAAFTTTENATMILDADALTNEESAFIQSGEGTKVKIGGSIKVLNAQTGMKLHLANREDLETQLVSKIITDNIMQDVKIVDGELIITVADAATALPGTIIPAIVTNLTDKNISNAFFDEMLKSGDAAKATAAINSIANMGELAGVNHGTYSMSNTMTDAVAHHLSLATHGEQDKDIWAHYIHNKEDVDGMTLGGIDANYDAQFNGIVVGSDLYKNGKTTAGIALSYADGNINGYNGIARSKNDAEYYGATLYGRIENENSAVLGNITYMHSDNDVTQTNSGHEITASADADAFSIGVRAEQAIKAGAGKFVPYAGLRYMHLGAGDYTNSLGMEYNADDQNLWLLPVGVTYSAEIASGDWTLKPIAEVGYVWTMGDRETDQTVYLNGAADSFGFETADSGSFISRFGLEAQNGSMTYGLGYEYQKGDSVKANRWLVNMVYSF